MRKPESAAFDESRVTSESREFAAQLFLRFPELLGHAAMERDQNSGEWGLVVTAAAPSGDPKAALVVWMDGGKEPSVGFGSWHTHEGVWQEESANARAALLDLIEGILADRIVICEDFGGLGDGTATVLDMSDEDALLDELTSRYSPGRARIRSWSGGLDRIVGLDDLE